MNYGWDGCTALRIADDDLMPDTQAEVYAICRKYGLTHLIYVGFHTQVCLLGKPMGLKAMKSAGLNCVLARDMTDAHPGYDPARNFTPDLNTEQVVEHFEKHLAPTISFQDELTRLGKWDTNWVVDPVRIAPWGTPMRPHCSSNHHGDAHGAARAGCGDSLYAGWPASDGRFHALLQAACVCGDDSIASRRLSRRARGLPGIRRILRAHGPDAAGAGCSHR